jgi:hypothetical protein
MSKIIVATFLSLDGVWSTTSSTSTACGRTRSSSGTGKRLFEQGAVPAALKLVDTRTTSTGVVMNTYQRAGKPEFGSFALDQ